MMQTDVKNKYMNATGAAGIGTTRVKGIYIISTGTSGDRKSTRLNSSHT